MAADLKRFSIAILAGGMNRRFNNRNKALLKWDNTPLIEKYLETLSPLTGDLFLITNSPELFAGYAVRSFADIIPGKGPLSGIHSALHHSVYKHTLILACDMPFINTKIITELYELSDTYPELVIAPAHANGIETLVSIWPETLFTHLDKWLMGDNPKKILDFLNHHHCLHKMMTDTDTSDFTNINSDDDLEEARKRLAMVDKFRTRGMNQ